MRGKQPNQIYALIHRVSKPAHPQPELPLVVPNQTVVKKQQVVDNKYKHRKNKKISNFQICLKEDLNDSNLGVIMEGFATAEQSHARVFAAVHHDSFNRNNGQ